MDNKISIGDKLELEIIENRLSSDSDIRKKIYLSQILDEMENGNLLVAMPMQEGKIIPLSVGQKFYATFHTKSALLRCEVEAIARYKKGTLFLLEISQQTVLEKVQRRKFFRLNCRMPLEYRILEEEEIKCLESPDNKGYEVDEKELEWKKGIVLDISGGGMRFVSGEHEEKNCLICTRFEIEIENNIEVIILFAILLRSERNDNNHSIYDNHAMFWKIDKHMQEKIIRYTFDQQRKIRSKESGME